MEHKGDLLMQRPCLNLISQIRWLERLCVCVLLFSRNSAEYRRAHTLAGVGGWAHPASPSPPCAPIHRMCSMSSHPSPLSSLPSLCFLLECAPPFPERLRRPIGRARRTGRRRIQPAAAARELVSPPEWPMARCGDGREAGARVVGGSA